MNIEYKKFIGLYSDVYPEGYCQHLIDQFNILETAGAGNNRLKSEGALHHTKADHQIFIPVKGSDDGVSILGHSYNIENFNGKDIASIFFDGLQQCFEEYTNTFSILKSKSMRATAMKMQRTPPGGGYHLWHDEQGSDETVRRALVYSLYLNTIAPENAGETEFLYQKERYSPVENTMLFWPAAYTHVHRGNTVFGNESKYIVTGWFFYD
jgi:hypothetical protein